MEPPAPTGLLIDPLTMHRTLVRLASEVIERNPDLTPLAMVGLPTRGVALALRLQHYIQGIAKADVPVGQIDISFHRDDLDLHVPVPRDTSVPFDVDGRVIVLVDDVLFTGRSARAALDALCDLGRPEAIQLLTLVDREGHRRLPIHADYCGKAITTDFAQHVRVLVQEVDGDDRVEVLDGRAAA